MTKDEMKNKISMALKDPILQQGFECICKENAELKEQIEKMKSDVMANIKWADKNCDNMWQKLVKMWNQWEIKENEI